MEVWLVKVIQALIPFVSSAIESGARWDAEIAARLEETGDGIVIITSRNQNEPWLNFEAGALAKATATSRVRPLLIDLAPSDISGPLNSFQATRASDKEAVLKMLMEINNRCEHKLAEGILKQTFEREWPDFETKLGEVIALDKAGGATKPPKRGESEVLAEILDRVRAIEREALEQRFQISGVASRLAGVTFSSPSSGPLAGVTFSSPDLAIENRWLFREDPQQAAAQRAADEAAAVFVGSQVTANTSEHGKFQGTVLAALTRGTGVYLRIEAEDGTIRTVPMRAITTTDDDRPEGLPE